MVSFIRYAARALWHLSTQLPNQYVFVQNNAIPDFVATLRNGSTLAQMLAAASLAELARGYIYQTQGPEIAFGSRDCNLKLRIAFGLPSESLLGCR